MEVLFFLYLFAVLPFCLKLSQSSTVATDIAKEIHGVNRSAGNSSSNIDHIHERAESLSERSRLLAERVNRFRT